MKRADDGLPHGLVMTDLLHLQARLRGDPATLHPPRGVQTPSLEPENASGSRVDAMRRRLAALELEIDAYERLLYAWPPAPARPDADVIDLAAHRDRVRSPR
jgi:hypothetical protein